MRRRLVDLCLLAYPAPSRQHDGAYLRDLALELAPAQGLSRQLASLLWGGLAARFRRTRPAAAVTALAAGLLVTALAATSVVVLLVGSSEHEVEARSCVTTAAVGDSGCAALDQLVEAKERQGWACDTSERVVDGRRQVGVECRSDA